MNLTYKKASIKDIDILTKTRIEVLRVANQLSEDTDIVKWKENLYNYYQKALRNRAHIAYLVFGGTRFVGAGGC